MRVWEAALRHNMFIGSVFGETLVCVGWDLQHSMRAIGHAAHRASV